MATSIKEGLNYIIQAIQNMIEPQLDKLRYDRTYRAKVLEKVKDGVYRVQINGSEYQIKYNGNLNIGSVVKVKAPLNNFSDIYPETTPITKTSELINDAGFISDPNYSNWEGAKPINVNAHRIFRKIQETGLNNYQYEDKDYYSHNGGFAYIGNGNIVVASIPRNKSSDSCLIELVNIDTGEVLRSIIGDFGHSNSITYDNKRGKIYCAEAMTVSQNYSNRIFEFDYSTLNLVATHEVKNNAGSVTYDKVNDKLYYFSGETLYELDDNFNTVKSITLSGTPYNFGFIQQTVEVNGDFVYRIVSYPESIFVYNKHTGKFLQAYNLPEYLDDSFGIGECEDLTYYNGDIYFLSEYHPVQNGDFNWYNVSRTSTEHNTLIQNNNLPFATNFSKDVICDNTTNTPLPNGTKNKPFNEIAEICDYASSPVGKQFNILVNVKATNKHYRYCYINTKNTISINGIGGKPMIDGLRINSVDMLLNELSLFSYNTINKSPVYTNNNSLKLNNIEYTTNVTYNIYTSTAEIILLGNHIRHTANSVFIYATSGALIHTNNKYLDIIAASSSAYIDATYVLINGALSTVGSTIDVNNYMKSINYNFSNYNNNYKYLNIVYQTSATSGKKIVKFNIGVLGSKYSINDINLFDQTSSPGGQVIEATITTSANALTLSNVKFVNLITGEVITKDDFKITDVFYSNT